MEFNKAQDPFSSLSLMLVTDPAAKKVRLLGKIIFEVCDKRFMLQMRLKAASKMLGADSSQYLMRTKSGDRKGQF